MAAARLQLDSKAFTDGNNNNNNNRGGSSSSGITQDYQVLQAGKHTHVNVKCSTALPQKQQAYGITLLLSLSRRLADAPVITEDTREIVFLFQRLSIALQRGNAVSLNTMNTE